MNPDNSIDALTKKLFSILPTGVQNIENDLKQQFSEILKAGFANLDLVTRDEFDVQVKVLARTREKIEQLQRTVEIPESIPRLLRFCFPPKTVNTIMRWK